MYKKAKRFLHRGVVCGICAAMALSMAGCSKKTDGLDVPAFSEVTVKEQIVPDVQPIEEVDPTQQVTSGYINPLTGEATEKDLSDTRPVAAMLNTTKIALPQSGNASADILVEMQEEGGMTRIMGIFSDISQVGNIGCIRSTREYFAYIAMGYDAVLLHCGGSSYGLAALENNGYKTLNEMKFGSLYWRDSWRQQNLGQEHSLYTSGENIYNYLESVDEDTMRSEHWDGYEGHMQFAADGDGTPENGSSATSVDVIHSSYKSTNFVYDEESHTYKVSCFGSAYMDEDSGEQVAVTNILVLQTNQRTKEDGTGEGRQEYDLDAGTGYYACGGKYIPITWSKGGTYEDFTFYDQDGNVLQLGVGKTYINIVDYSRTIQFS